MLNAEYEGVKEMAETGTIKVPRPIAFGEFHGKPRNMAFVVFEYLQFVGGGSGYELGQQLAKVRQKLKSERMDVELYDNSSRSTSFLQCVTK